MSVDSRHTINNLSSHHSNIIFPGSSLVMTLESMLSILLIACTSLDQRLADLHDPVALI